MGLLNTIQVNHAQVPSNRADRHICLGFTDKGLFFKQTHDHILFLAPPMVCNAAQLLEDLRIIAETCLLVDGAFEVRHSSRADVMLLMLLLLLLAAAAWLACEQL